MFCVTFFILFLSNSDGILQIVLDKNTTFLNCFGIRIFFLQLFEHCCQSCVKHVDLCSSNSLQKIIFSVNRPPFRIVYLCLHFKLNILVFYLLFCLKVYER